MADQAVYCFLFLLTLFEMFTKTKMSAQGNGHGKELIGFNRRVC